MKRMSRQKCEDSHATERSSTASDTRPNPRCCLTTFHGSCSRIAPVAAFLVTSSSWRHYLEKKRCPQMFSCWRSSSIWSLGVLRVWKCRSKCWLQGGHQFGEGMGKSQVLAWGFVQMQGWRQLSMVTELGCRSSSLLRRSTPGWMRRLLWVCGLGVWIWLKGYKSGTHISGNYLISLWNTDGRIKWNHIR